MNKLQWNFNQNTKLFINENASETIVCEIMAFCPVGDELILQVPVAYSQRDGNLVITVPANVLTPHGSRPPTCTLLTKKQGMLSTSLYAGWHDLWLPLFYQITSFKIVNLGKCHRSYRVTWNSTWVRVSQPTAEFHADTSESYVSSLNEVNNGSFRKPF